MFIARQHGSAGGLPRARVRLRLIVAMAGIALAGLTLAPPAIGRDPDAHLLTRDVYTGTHCPLERIGEQFVRCDNLTGNGARAPSHIPEAR